MRRRNPPADGRPGVTVSAWSHRTVAGSREASTASDGVCRPRTSGSSPDGSAGLPRWAVGPRGGGAALAISPLLRRVRPSGVSCSHRDYSLRAYGVENDSDLEGISTQAGPEDFGEQVAPEMALPARFYGSEETWLSRRSVVEAGSVASEKGVTETAR